MRAVVANKWIIDTPGKKQPLLYFSNSGVKKYIISMLMLWALELICYTSSESLYCADLKDVRCVSNL